MRNDSKIYCFSLFDSGYTVAHSLIRELFDSPKTICPSLSQGDLLYVLSKNPPIKSLHHKCYNIKNIDNKVKSIDLETHVAFCNRHRENITPKTLFSKEALDKFCFLSGLSVDKANCKFLGCHSEKKFNIHNTFYIQGTFNIHDHKKINHSLINGIGSRKSYGYGLILIKRGGKYESAN